MRVSVFGLGYVGCVSAGCLVRDGHEVIGCDIDPVKLQLMGEGKSPIVEAGMAELIAAAADSGRLRLTDTAAEAVAGSELSLICVGTPSTPVGDQDLSAVARLSEQLGAALAERQEHHVVVLRSTVSPGTLRELVIPKLEAASGKRAGEGFSVAFQPEFLREGSSIRDYDNPPFTVVGTEHPRALAALRALYGHLPAELLHTSPEAAEALKMCANTFHALKISFANEVGRVSQAVGVDPHEVMRLLCEDTQLNISPAYLRPGFAFGGSCLPKDVRALNRLAQHHDVSVPLLSSLIPSNQAHVDTAVDWVLSTGRRKIGLIGLSFKAGTDDLRESPLVTLAERFIGKGLSLSVYDPAVSMARLIGANRRYIEGSIPHISKLMRPDLSGVIAEAELLVVGQSSPEICAALAAHSRADQLLLDLVRLPEPEGLPAAVHGLCW